MKTQLIKNTRDSFNELDNILFAFSDEQLNSVPFKDSWTAGQVGEHIIKALSGLPSLMNGPAEATERDPGEKIKGLEDLFLNFSIKMQSPDFILPGNGPHDKDSLLRSVENSKAAMLDAVEMDLDLLCTAAELPGFGQLTRLEWIHFSLAHTQRHTRQLKNIFQTFKKNMTQINSYLTFNGNCREAMSFYAASLGAELTLQTIGESPLADKMPPQMKESILHSTLSRGELVMMGSDMVSEKGLVKGNSVSLMLNCSSEEEIRSLYEVLSKDGEATHPLETSFWGALFGDLTDKFGNHWLLHFDQSSNKNAN